METERLEDLLVPAEWTERDTDMVVQSMLFERAGLRPVASLD